MIDETPGRNDWPPYSYVPGGPWPHPTRDRDGHSHGLGHPVAAPIAGENWPASSAYRRGVDLFNAGFYWEAHESWEALWHAHDRSGATADVLKALIKLAAAGVKVREGQPHGVSTHAGRAARLFGAVAASAGPRRLGLDLGNFARIASDLAERPPTAASGKDVAVAVVFGFRIEPVEP